MKKIYLFIITVICLSSFAQKDYSRYYNSWRLGLNIGGAWQTADYRSCWGMAGGITLEKGFHENKTNIFSFAIRGRYLAANTYGMDYNRNYDIKTNNAYNGKYDMNVNYVDTVHIARSYVYDNYKMQLGEGSLELQITFNRLRERTHVLLNLWGGIGFTSYRTKSDLLDGNGKMYDFSQVDSSGNKTKALNTYNGLIDKKYESYAYGSKNGRLVTFSPSLGIGLGYQFSPGFSMLWEYKVTFPQGTNADLLDGKLSANKDALGGSNDYYHYTGLNLVFTLRGKHKTTNTPVKDETVYTPPVQPTNPVAPVLTPANPVVQPTDPVVTTPPPPVTEQKPYITFITPPVSGQTVNNPQYKLSAEILNVSGPNQIQFKLNGVGYSNFTYNPQNHILEYNATLVNGNNTIQLSASNSAGTDNRSTSIIYQQQKPVGNPPVVSYINPSQTGQVSTSQSYVVKAQVLNVAAQNGISVYVNGMSSPFTYDANNKQVSIPLSLNAGTNVISITANNQAGEDTKETNVIYTAASSLKAPPLVTIINPNVSLASSLVPNYTFKATVTNITSKAQLTVKLNGNVVSNFAFALPNVIIPVTLIQGNNILEVVAANNDGSDSKTATVNYKQKTLSLPPVINLMIPSSEINATDNLLYNFKLSVLNVASKSDIGVVFNGVTQSNFTYDATTKEVFFQTNLSVGSNTLFVKATNQDGTASKQITVQYTPHAEIKLPPVVTINNPFGTTANVSNPNYTFKATVTNMPNTNGLTVKFNGTVISNYTYDGSNLIYQATLVQGNNTFNVSAVNNDGNDTKNAIVTYRPKVVAIPPVVNLINPSSEINATDNLLYNFRLSVLNVNSKSDIEVVFNGTVQSNYTYDATTKEVFFQTNLSIGPNSLSVKGTNQFGIDTKQISVEYTPHADIKSPPVITFVAPGNMAGTSQTTNFVFMATIANMPNTNGMTVTYNGLPVSDYTYDGANLSYTAALSTGTNTLQIAASNTDGNDLKAATVTYKPRVVARPPVVVVTQPVASPTVTTESYNFQFKAFNVAQAQLEVMLNGKPVTTYSFSSSNGNFTTNLIPEKNTLSVKATNADGSVTKTADIYLMQPGTGEQQQSTNLSDTTRHNAGTSSGKMVICHRTEGNDSQTISIPASAWPAHEAHGDTRGECPAKNNTTPVIPNHVPASMNGINEQPIDTLKKQPVNTIPINTTPRRPR
ncbi:MAG: hypothetical protein HY062_14320 [Bacteroidetes bacterium]|nr:hypothetical protein [Bacteroidota bacterium]